MSMISGKPLKPHGDPDRRWGREGRFPMTTAGRSLPNRQTPRISRTSNNLQNPHKHTKVQAKAREEKTSGTGILESCAWEEEGS